jgi:metal-responsive CopG/Arc/MetJ family transcriptional regulator
VNVKIPEELMDEVDVLIKEGALGYRSRAEFVSEAIRERLIKVRELLARSSIR